ncbi:DUF418 domain-containing protein [Nocardiopsis prasina]|uniref:DUF418 domain-containing protein n=1 Tax=Nocardiopsis prasina TaxID=2015 RepID=UPI0003454E25|nr:DUF418 domain-containing protein [Nocardiopsis prasina]
MTTASTPAGAPATAPPGGAPDGGPARRVALLDVARALAMIGVVAMNAPTVVFAAERLGEVEQSTLASIVDGALGLLMSGKARALLMVLLGVGAVLAWRSATRRGGRPMAVMLRRYVVLGVLFGVPHLLVFHGDILTHYALTALVLAPLMPFLLAGRGNRPLWFAVALFATAPFAGFGLGTLFPGSQLDILVTLIPQTLGFFCVGVWLARRPELDPERADEPTRLPARMMWTGLVGQMLGLVALYGADLFFPMEFDSDGIPVMGPDGVPVVSPGSDMMVSFGASLGGLGGALFFLGLVWWLVRRDRTGARALGTLAPLGRMTLTVYLGSTAVFLLSMKPFEGEIPLLAQYGIAAAYFVVMALFARWWLGRFRLGPLEWIWRSLTYLRPIPMRRIPEAVTSSLTEPERVVSGQDPAGRPGTPGEVSRG